MVELVVMEETEISLVPLVLETVLVEVVEVQKTMQLKQLVVQELLV